MKSRPEAPAIHARNVQNALRGGLGVREQGKKVLKLKVGV